MSHTIDDICRSFVGKLHTIAAENVANNVSMDGDSIQLLLGMIKRDGSSMELVEHALETLENILHTSAVAFIDQRGIVHVLTLVVSRTLSTRAFCMVGGILFRFMDDAVVTLQYDFVLLTRLVNTLLALDDEECFLEMVPLLQHASDNMILRQHMSTMHTTKHVTERVMRNIDDSASQQPWTDELYTYLRLINALIHTAGDVSDFVDANGFQLCRRCSAVYNDEVRSRSRIVMSLFLTVARIASGVECDDAVIPRLDGVDTRDMEECMRHVATRLLAEELSFEDATRLCSLRCFRVHILSKVDVAMQYVRNVYTWLMNCCAPEAHTFSLSRCVDALMSCMWVSCVFCNTRGMRNETAVDVPPMLQFFLIRIFMLLSRSYIPMTSVQNCACMLMAAVCITSCETSAIACHFGDLLRVAQDGMLHADGLAILFRNPPFSRMKEDLAQRIDSQLCLIFRDVVVVHGHSLTQPIVVHGGPNPMLHVIRTVFGDVHKCLKVYAIIRDHVEGCVLQTLRDTPSCDASFYTYILEIATMYDLSDSIVYLAKSAKQDIEQRIERLPIDLTITSTSRCPISLETMRYPVVASDGNTYELEELIRHAQTSTTDYLMSPMTRAHISSTVYYNRHAVSTTLRRITDCEHTIKAAAERQLQQDAPTPATPTVPRARRATSPPPRVVHRRTARRFHNSPETMPALTVAPSPSTTPPPQSMSPTVAYDDDTSTV